MSDAQATGTTQPSAARWRRRVTLGLLALLAVGLLLLIPDPSPLPPTPAPEMKLISQPIDFYGVYIYSGDVSRRGASGASQIARAIAGAIRTWV